MNKKVVIALNSAWNFVNFRAGLIRALISEGYEVVAVAPVDEYVGRVESLGCKFVPVPMSRKGTNPAQDLLLLWRLYAVLRRERPCAFLGYTVKPNVYGALAARLAGVPVINNIAGLGSAFVKQSWLTRLVKFLYRIALSKSRVVFFQNIEDQQMFIEEGIVDAGRTDCLPGSGVDLSYFAPEPIKSSGFDGDDVRFLLVARMLWDKGVHEYVEAARILRLRYPRVKFSMLGPIDDANPAAVSRSYLDGLASDGVVEYLGGADDVRAYIAASDCVVLPSYYREGTPRSLLEAAAMSRPIVTTDSVGCRNVVEHGVNGFLVRPRDTEDLACKLESIVRMGRSARENMGLLGRDKVEREFDEKIVIRKYISKLEGIC